MGSVARRISALIVCVLVLVSPVLAYNGNTTVYVTATGRCYHKSGCSYLTGSARAVTLENAVKTGHYACSRCKPPALQRGGDMTRSSSGSGGVSYGVLIPTAIGGAAAGVGGMAIRNRKRNNRWQRR